MQRAQKKTGGMVDVSPKDITRREAVATARVSMTPLAWKAFVSGTSPKGDVLEAARIAGILAAKATPGLIPMCHPLELTSVHVSFEIQKKGRCVDVSARVGCLGRTGVEMEAMTAAAIAALTIYDMMKWADKGMVISDVRLLKKHGGKSGDYHRA
ncbi:MAG: cyclic pyranopterin monophosphate synthase MoaC [Candidatus Omnitrophota bacterium]|nr:cyclic pyranopterin monophosphate synthase MoaC [Candidatus Omnitrophota bacterium]MDZ4243469.1 cyclic pyranopterin monophosphate synthase MoaC [Candidatus Omnitrophota bacterium]